jgi:hypothetical protein
VQHAAAVVLAFLLLMVATIGVFVLIPFVSNYAFWFAILAYVILYWGSRIGASWPGIISLILVALAVVGVFINIPFVSNYAFWFAIAAYVIRDWTFNSDNAHMLIWIGLISLVVAGFAVAGVFIDIPIVSNYAYWFVIAAFMIRLLAHIPFNAPQRVGAWRP